MSSCVLPLLLQFNSRCLFPLWASNGFQLWWAVPRDLVSFNNFGFWAFRADSGTDVYSIFHRLRHFPPWVSPLVPANYSAREKSAECAHQSDGIVCLRFSLLRNSPMPNSLHISRRGFYPDRRSVRESEVEIKRPWERRHSPVSPA